MANGNDSKATGSLYFSSLLNIIDYTFLFGPIRCSVGRPDGLKLGATSSDILDCVTYVTIRQGLHFLLLFESN